MIIITGPGRCGTSMMALYCNEIGLDIDIGPHLARLDAGYESAKSMTVNQSFIKHYHLKLNLEHVNYHTEKIQAINFEVVKDPLFVVMAESIEYWWRARKDLVILYMTRDPNEIVASQKRHPEMNTPTYRCFVDMLIKKEKEFNHTVNKLGIPLQRVVYPEQVKFSWVYPFFKKHFNRLEENECKRTWNEVIRLPDAKIDIAGSDKAHTEQ